jgi:hypothetical protein
VAVGSVPADGSVVVALRMSAPPVLSCSIPAGAQCATRSIPFCGCGTRGVRPPPSPLVVLLLLLGRSAPPVKWSARSVPLVVWQFPRARSAPPPVVPGCGERGALFLWYWCLADAGGVTRIPSSVVIPAAGSAEGPVVVDRIEPVRGARRGMSRRTPEGSIPVFTLSDPSAPPSRVGADPGRVW